MEGTIGCKCMASYRVMYGQFGKIACSINGRLYWGTRSDQGASSLAFTVLFELVMTIVLV